MNRAIVDLGEPRFVKRKGRLVVNSKRKRVINMTDEEIAKRQAESDENRVKDQLEAENREKKREYKSLFDSVMEKRIFGEPVDAADITRLRQMKATLEE